MMPSPESTSSGGSSPGWSPCRRAVSAVIRAGRERPVGARRVAKQAAPRRGPRRAVAASAALLAGVTGLAAVGVVTASSADAATPATFSATQAMPVGLTDASAVVLAGGDVLVAGGDVAANGSPSANAELYDPSNGSWSFTGTMPLAVAGASAVLLGDGDVLLAGGSTGSGTALSPTGSAELYDPSTNAWSQTGSLPGGLAVSGASATVLPGGEVLLAGGMVGTGSTASTTAQAELYSPSTQTWTSTGALPLGVANAQMAAFTQNGGGVLLAGGLTKSSGGTASVTSTAEVYNQSTGTWTQRNAMPVPVADATASLLATGDVLVAGGETSPSGSATNAAQLFDPATGGWSTTGYLPTSSYAATATVLASGQVLVAGGELDGSGTPTNAAALYSPSTGAWSPTGSLLVARFGAVAARLASGDVLIAGGSTSPSSVTADAELYTASAGPAFTSPATLAVAIGTYSSFTVTTSGTPTPVVSAVGTLPSGLAFTANANGTATISGTPAVGTAGTYDLTLTASNGVGSATQTLVVSVAASAAPKITSASSVELVAGSANTFTVSATGVPLPTLTESGALPPGVSFTANANGTATISGTPTGTGSYTVAIVATNGVGSPATQTLHITVGLASGTSITSASAVDLPLGVASHFTVTSHGTPTPTLTVSGTLPPGLVFTPGAGGTATISGTPAALGTFPVTVVATNGVGSPATQTLVITIVHAAGTAFTSRSSIAIRPGVSFRFYVTTTGSPAASITEAGTLPPGTTFKDLGSGVGLLAGTASASDVATYVVTLSAANGVGPSARQVLHIAVVRPAPPAFTSTSTLQLTTRSHVRFVVTLTGAVPMQLTATGTLPLGVHLAPRENGTAIVYGAPDQSASGSYALTITASNPSGSATQTLHITVVAAGATAPVSTGHVLGYWYAESTGQVIHQGAAVLYPTTSRQGPRQVVAMATSATGNGYYLVSSFGGVYNYGDAPFYGSLARTHISSPIVGFALATGSTGYYLLAANGEVYSFGGARYFGSPAGIQMTAAAAAIAVTPGDQGYWVVTKAGTVYSYGDARPLSNLRVDPATMPVVAIEPTATGNGYWIATARGNVFNYGDAGFHGSLARRVLPAPVTAFAATPSGAGYYLVTSKGNVFNLGDARFYGSSARTVLPGRITSVAVYMG